MVCLLSAAALVTTAHAADAPLKAGFAERDISPEIGMEQPGGYGKAYHRTFHDPCKVRAAVFDDGQSRVAIVGLDALVIRGQTVRAARNAIQQRCGIWPDAILISASHSHSSGPTGMILPGEYDHASTLVQKLAYEKSSCADAGYLKKVETAIIDAVCEADQKRVAARCGVGTGVEDQVAFNRRFRMRSGLTNTHPRQGNPDIVEAAGPTDPTVGVVGAWNEQGKLLGCIVNYACHATTSPGGISANYICYLEQVIRGSLGSDAIVVFLPGASGDVTQVDNLSPYAGRTGEDSARFVGGRIGAEAVKVLLTITPGTLAPLAARTTTLQIKRRVPRPERVRQALELVAQDPPRDATEWTFAKEIVLLDALLAKEPVRTLEVQAVQVGPAVFVTTPAEYFCQFGLDIKAQSPFRFTFPVSLANDAVGYVPTAEALGPRGGGYETRLTSYSNLEPTAGQQMADAGIALAKQMKPGAVPLSPSAPPYQKNAWAYGDVPPEVD
ncbi:MAG: hypothetical protein HY000_06280 [Planctomycetes bacterium]|nr:hypothetical protein [Planctomycetota bacterium]